MRVVLYTSCFGDRDELRPVIPQAWEGGHADCIAFTDRAPSAGSGHAEGWQVIPAYAGTGLGPESHPRMQAKYFKLNPHECLRDYDLSVWVDASLRVHSPHLVRDLARYVKESAVAFFPHRWRTTLAEELAAHLPLRKYAGLPIREQVASYFAEGYADQVPLLECTCIVRRHNDRGVVALDEAWWEECRRWTYADQLSLPYVLWKRGTPYTRLPFNLDQQHWFRWATWRDD